MTTKSFLGFLSLAFILTSCGNSGKKGNTLNDSTAIVNEAAPAIADASAETVKKYPIKSAIVTFEGEMMGIKEKTILYFDDYGMKEAEEKYDGDNIKSSTLCDGKTRYTIVYKEKTAYPDGDCYRGVAYKFDWDEISKADKKYKAKKLANVSIAGKDCESFSMESSGNPIVYAGWNNICTLIDQDTKYGKITYKAVKIEENIAIPNDKLNVPTGFAIKKAAM